MKVLKDTVTNPEQVNLLTHKDFLKLAQDLTTDVKVFAYNYLMYFAFTYMRRNDVPKSHVVSISDRLHNLPLFLSRNLEGFKEDAMWYEGSKTDAFLLPMMKVWFMSGVYRAISDPSIRD